MSLLAGMGVGGPPESARPELVPQNARTERPTLNQAMTLEELERSFEVKNRLQEVDQKSKAPPPGFSSSPLPSGPRVLAPGPIGHHRPQPPMLPGFSSQFELENHLSQAGLFHMQSRPGSSPQTVLSGMMSQNHPANPIGSQHHPANPIGSQHQPANPSLFRPFDPQGVRPSFPMLPSAFNPFNSFGPIIGPGDNFIRTFFVRTSFVRTHFVRTHFVRTHFVRTHFVRTLVICH